MEGEDEGGEVALSVERYAEMDANQQFVLTVTELGYGKTYTLTSAARNSAGTLRYCSAQAAPR